MCPTETLSVLSRRLNYSFSNDALLIEALTHRSVGSVNNERLEFLGDSVLNFVIAEVLYLQYPDMREGDLSRLRASLVNGDVLAEIGRELNLGDFLKLGTGELKSGGFRRKSILADAVESIIGAIYLDSNFDTCRSQILKLYSERLKNIPDVESLKDPKTRLQELLQSRRYPLPVYEVMSVSGEAHSQVFLVKCEVGDIGCVAQGEGSSRRKAEQVAAEKVLLELQNRFKKTS